MRGMWTTRCAAWRPGTAATGCIPTRPRPARRTASPFTTRSWSTRSCITTCRRRPATIHDHICWPSTPRRNGATTRRERISAQAGRKRRTPSIIPIGSRGRACSPTRPTRSLSLPIRTTLNNPLTRVPYVITTYFETDFNFQRESERCQPTLARPHDRRRRGLLSQRRGGVPLQHAQRHGDFLHLRRHR